MIDAASNVAVLVLAINLSNPARPNLPPFELTSLQVVFMSYALLDWTPPAEYPVEAILFSGTWEQVQVAYLFPVPSNCSRRAVAGDCSDRF